MNVVCAIGGQWGMRAAIKAAAACGGRWEFVYSVGGLNSAIREVRPQFVMFLNWSRKVPASVLAQTTAVNFHCTPLPYGRGGHPIENMILRGHSQTVISAHVMTDELDAGPVYGVSEPISLAGSKDDIRQRFIEPAAALMAQIVRGEMQPQPQVGDPVIFQRLSDSALRAFWAARQEAA